jgi:hypothetical protein
MRSIQYEISDDGAFARVRVRNANGAPRTLELDYDTVVELGVVMNEIDAAMTDAAMGGGEDA